MTAMAIEAKDIILSAHVVDRYRERALADDDLRDFSTIDSEIRELILEGVERNGLQNHKPKAFRLYGEHRKSLPENERFVECGRLGFLLRRTSNETWVVTTIMHRTGGTPS